jgi:hypothetical protein
MSQHRPLQRARRAAAEQWKLQQQKARESSGEAAREMHESVETLL